MRETTPLFSISRLIDLGSEWAEKRFKADGQIDAQFIAVTADAKIMIVPFPSVADRDEGFNLIRELFVAKDVVAYVYVSEVWTAISVDAAELRNIPPAQRKDRKEGVIISAESEQEGQRVIVREIVRPSDGKPYLDAHKPDDWSIEGGRMVGLLAQRTTLQ